MPEPQGEQHQSEGGAAKFAAPPFFVPAFRPGNRCPEAPSTTVQSEDARWTLLIVVPPELFKQVQLVAQAKAPKAAMARLVTLNEGRAMQVMHVGPYDAETPTIARLEAFARDAGLQL